MTIDKKQEIFDAQASKAYEIYEAALAAKVSKVALRATSKAADKAGHRAVNEVYKAAYEKRKKEDG